MNLQALSVGYGGDLPFRLEDFAGSAEAERTMVASVTCGREGVCMCEGVCV
jgi:hypothetical protein